ncbi:MAG: Gldg family protein [Bacteroidota bacterium]
MRKIIKIARLELNILFYSPVAWLVLTIFMVQCGVTFLENLQNIRTSLSLGYQTMPITRSLFSGAGGLFTSMQGYIYLYLPILTMGLMSRETSSGSIKLLLSSPVKLRQIILGKYLAIAGYGFTLICVLMIFAVIGGLFIKDVDFGFIFSGLLALYLLICTYAAIGLFMSCLTTYQVVAAISTLAVFAMMRYIGTLWQDIDFVRDITYFLSISGRTEKMIGGMITTKDVLYYLIIIGSFLSLCVLRLKSERELKPWTIKTGRYIVLLFVALGLGYITSRQNFTGYLDTTSGKSLTITKNSQTIARKIDGTLKVTTYANMLAPNLFYVLPQSRNSDIGNLEKFRRFIPDMELNYVYYYQDPVDPNFGFYKMNPNIKGITNIDKIADKMAITMGIDGEMFIKPAEIDKQVDLKPEGYLTVRKLEYKGKTTFLRFYVGDFDPYPSEAEVGAALKRLLIKAPKILFLTGNNERDIYSKADRGYQQVSSVKTRRNALVNQGFDVDTLNINSQEIPSDVDIIVLADPTTELSQTAQQKISGYIAKGGDMMILGEPGRQQILNPLLKQFGVKLKEGLLVKKDKDLTPGFVNAHISETALNVDSNFTRIQKRRSIIPIQGASAIETDSTSNFKFETLLMSAEGGWNKVFATEVVNKPMMMSKLSAVFKPAFKTKNTNKIILPKGAVIASGGTPNNEVLPAPAAKLQSINLNTANMEVAVKKADTVKSSKADSSDDNALPVASGMAMIAPGGTSTRPDLPPPPPKLGSIDLATADLTFNANNGDQKGIFPVAATLTRTIQGKQQRIVISGDADFMSNGEVTRAGRQFNEPYMQGIFRWFSDGNFPIDVTRAPAKDTDIKISRGQITGLMWVCKAIIPALIAIFGAIVLFKRRRK